MLDYLDIADRSWPLLGRVMQVHALLYRATGGRIGGRLPGLPPMLLLEHVVTQGERLDNITAQYLDDPEQFWRVCDANRAMCPDELTEEVGRRLRITLPEGIPGTPNA